MESHTLTLDEDPTRFISQFNSQTGDKTNARATQ